MDFGYIRTVADLNGWSSEDKHEAMWGWLDPRNTRNTKNDIGIWMVSMDVIKLVRSAPNRRALWAWAASKAGGEGFNHWCKRREGISRQSGNWRRKEALSIN